MNEISITEKPKQQIKLTKPLNLETLGKGVADINSGYPLQNVVTFINDLDVKTSAWTGQPEGALSIAFPTPTLFRINRLREYDSIIYITGPIKKQEPELRAQGERQVWLPAEFIAVIALDDNHKAQEAELITTVSKNELESMAKGIKDEIPKNWYVNLRIPFDKK